MGSTYPLSEKLLIKETPEEIPAPAPAPESAREALKNLLAPDPVPSFSRWDFMFLFLSTLVSVFVTVGFLTCLTNELNDRGYASAQKVLSFLPAFFYLAGATSAASCLALALQFVLSPATSYYLVLLNVVLWLALLVFFLGSLIFLHNIFFYVIFGAIAVIYKMKCFHAVDAPDS